MDRKIYASVTAQLSWPASLPRVDAEENLDCSFTAHKSQAATIEDSEIRTFAWLDPERLGLRVQLRLIIVADSELELQEIMQECDYVFSVDGQKINSSLTEWSVEDSK